ncbi:MAG TPA: chemotaxis protein CheW [bacterium]|nr:chemotaxis protein CheW [bacterium]
MDLVKARERAKQKAREEAEKKAAEEREKSAGGEASVRPAPPESPAAAAQVKEAAVPAARTVKPKKEKGAKKEPKKVKKIKAGPPAPAGAAERKPGPPALVPEAEVFTDDAFGEDLPPMELDQVLCDEVVLGDEAGKAAGKPGAADKEKAGSTDEDLSWEAQFEDIRRGAPEARAEKKPRESGRRPEPAKETGPAPASRAFEKLVVEDEDDRREARPPAGKAKPKNGAEWRVEEPAAPAKKPAPVKVELEWEDNGEHKPKAWSLDDLAGDDDFFALVTEDLYAREFGRPEDDDLGATLELLSFKLASEIYAVPLTSIRQIIKMIPITTVPRAPEYVLGIISLRGNIIPIFDLRRRLNLQSAETTRKTRIIVVAEGIYTVGLIVDEVEQVVRLPETSLEPPPPMLAGIEAGYIEGIGRHAKKMVLVLALDKILQPIAAGR